MVDVLTRNNVNIRGNGSKTILFAPGFGCDQNVWNLIVKDFEREYQVILFDYVGLGNSSIKDFDPVRYSTLNGYAQDVLDICHALNLEKVIFVGHSVSSMIGALASIKQPNYFEQLVMVGPSPCYLNDPPKYFGGFEKEELHGLIDMMEKNYIGWASMFASTVINNPARPDLNQEMENRFCSTDPVIARSFAEATFFADHRNDLKSVTTPSLILQCQNDLIASIQVGEYLHEHLPKSELKIMKATGHCPHLSHPEETCTIIKEYLKQTSYKKIGDTV